ncbi:hypothetical protein J4573_31730 [Actinomadura barringtoniae]|uniref:Uncharacterized protein n=1 Tax=Actinomadura barringtoniae TaxID=1427535 RepID=A0A939PM57_9ACTN|nr:hypothetical protein [Actinomadura barringtoniae]MBO2451699.1 hypothetical protein [Actinomadura barringtoniae]
MQDIVSSGPERPPGRTPRWVIVAGGLVLAGTVLSAAVALHSGDHKAKPAPTPTPSSTGPVVPDGPDVHAEPGDMPALVLKNGHVSAMDRIDSAAEYGPWTVTLRARNGSLVSGGAVVTFPVHQPALSRRVTIAGADGRGWAAEDEVAWRTSGSYALVRGRLPERDLIRIAEATTIKDQRPAVRAPTGLKVIATGPYRSPVQREARYGTVDVGVGANGLAYAGVVRCGGLEDELYAANAQPIALDRHPNAVVTTSLGGNGLLAWEVEPGLLAYVGYSGVAMNATDVLRNLATRTRLISAAQWQTLRPTRIEGLNNPA